MYGMTGYLENYHFYPRKILKSKNDEKLAIPLENHEHYFS